MDIKDKYSYVATEDESIFTIERFLEGCTIDDVNIFANIATTPVGVVALIERGSEEEAEIERDLRITAVLDGKAEKTDQSIADAQTVANDAAQVIKATFADLEGMIEYYNKLTKKFPEIEAPCLERVVMSGDDLERLDKLDRLEAHSVDNWEGYDEAMSSNID